MVAVVKPHGTHLLREREASLYCAQCILRIARNVFSTMYIVHPVLQSAVLRVYSWQSTLYVDFMEAGHDNFTWRLFSNQRGVCLLVPAWLGPENFYLSYLLWIFFSEPIKVNTVTTNSVLIQCTVML